MSGSLYEVGSPIDSPAHYLIIAHILVTVEHPSTRHGFTDSEVEFSEREGDRQSGA